MLDYCEFIEEAEESIRDYLPECYSQAEVVTRTVRKLNREYTGMSVLPKDGGSIAATIDLDEAYRAYCQGMSFEDCMRQAAALVAAPAPLFDASGITDYEKARDRLFIRVSCASANAEVLSEVPHVLKGSLAVTCHIRITASDGSTGSVMVNNALLKEFGVDASRLMEDAVNNSAAICPPAASQLTGFIENGLEFQDGPDGISSAFSGAGLAVLSDRDSLSGAAVIMYPGLLESIYGAMGEGFYVIPSSIHEVLIVGRALVDDPAFLLEMVRNVNEQEVSPDERLGDTLFMYSPETGLREICG